MRSGRRTQRSRKARSIRTVNRRDACETAFRRTTAVVWITSIYSLYSGQFGTGSVYRKETMLRATVNWWAERLLRGVRLDRQSAIAVYRFYLIDMLERGCRSRPHRNRVRTR